jgi:hypothetical protein
VCRAVPPPRFPSMVSDHRVHQASWLCFSSGILRGAPTQAVSRPRPRQHAQQWHPAQCSKPGCQCPEPTSARAAFPMRRRLHAHRHRHRRGGVPRGTSFLRDWRLRADRTGVHTLPARQVSVPCPL